MNFLYNALAAREDPTSILTLVFLQVAVWSLLFEILPRPARRLLSRFAFWWRHGNNLKTNLGITAWEEIINNGCVIAWQHVMGTAMMATGIATGNHALFRWGVVSEIAYEVNDIILLWTKLSRHRNTAIPIQILSTAHHGLGLCMGLVCCLDSVSERADVQRYSLGLLASGAALLVVGGAVRTCNLNTVQGCYWYTAIGILHLSEFVYVRFVFPYQGGDVSLQALIAAASREGTPLQYYGLIMGIVTMNLFNVLFALVCLQRIVKSFAYVRKAKARASKREKEPVQPQPWTQQLLHARIDSQRLTLLVSELSPFQRGRAAIRAVMAKNRMVRCVACAREAGLARRAPGTRAKKEE